MSSLDNWTFGIIGGTGMLGSAIAHAVLNSGTIKADRMWVSNRSGQIEGLDGVSVTTDPQELADACDVILLCVPPASTRTLRIKAETRLVLSVMAGVSLSALHDLTGADRIVRAMSSPAAKQGLAYSPWCASKGVTAQDRIVTRAIFEACGQTDEIQGDEALIDVFTAMTGPVPGFVAFFADAVAEFAEKSGVPAEIADRAVRQLFLGAGALMANNKMTPADHVKEMIDYAGTTAAGLEVMQSSDIKSDVSKALDAAVARTRTIGL